MKMKIIYLIVASYACLMGKVRAAEYHFRCSPVCETNLVSGIATEWDQRKWSPWKPKPNDSVVLMCSAQQRADIKIPITTTQVVASLQQQSSIFDLDGSLFLTGGQLKSEIAGDGRFNLWSSGSLSIGNTHTFIIGGISSSSFVKLFGQIKNVGTLVIGPQAKFHVFGATLLNERDGVFKIKTSPRNNQDLAYINNYGEIEVTNSCEWHSSIVTNQNKLTIGTNVFSFAELNQKSTATLVISVTPNKCGQIRVSRAILAGTIMPDSRMQTILPGQRFSFLKATSELHGSLKLDQKLTHDWRIDSSVPNTLVLIKIR